MSIMTMTPENREDWCPEKEDRFVSGAIFQTAYQCRTFTLLVQTLQRLRVRPQAVSLEFAAELARRSWNTPTPLSSRRSSRSSPWRYARCGRRRKALLPCWHGSNKGLG